jgi:hypothetical protein
VPVADFLPEREHKLIDERARTAQQWTRMRDGVDDAIDLVLELATDVDAPFPRTKDEAARCLLTEHCPPYTDPVYEGVLEPLFHLAEDIPFGISRIITKG